MKTYLDPLLTELDDARARISVLEAAGTTADAAICGVMGSGVMPQKGPYWDWMQAAHEKLIQAGCGPQCLEEKR